MLSNVQLDDILFWFLMLVEIYLLADNLTDTDMSLP